MPWILASLSGQELGLLLHFFIPIGAIFGIASLKVRIRAHISGDVLFHTFPTKSFRKLSVSAPKVIVSSNSEESWYSFKLVVTLVSGSWNFFLYWVSSCLFLPTTRYDLCGLFCLGVLYEVGIECQHPAIWHLVGWRLQTWTALSRQYIGLVFPWAATVARDASRLDYS